MMKRMACEVCRCAGATSRPLSHCTAAHRVEVANGSPPRPGLLSPSALRSPPRSTGTSLPARSAREYKFDHFHSQGTIFGLGRTDMNSSSICQRSEEYTSELQSQSNLVCRLLLEKKNKNRRQHPGDQRL